MTDRQTARILVVDDDPDDRQIIKMAMKRCSVNLDEVGFLEDGHLVLEMLERLGEDDLWPELVLLDLNMVRMGGIEVIEQMEARGWLSSIVAIVLTTSSRDEDAERAYRAGAHSYITKPHSFGEFVECINVLVDYLERPLNHEPTRS